MKITKLEQFRSTAIERETGLLGLGLAVAAVFTLVLLALPAAHAQTFSVIHTFTAGNDGSSPWSGLTLKGTALYGAYGYRTIFKLSYLPGVGWQKTTLYDFQNASDGAYPGGGVISDNAGNLYGAAESNGVDGGGTVFELSPIGNGWTLNVLYGLPGTKGVNCGPVRPVSMDTAGNFYGTSECNGAYRMGNVFKLTKNGNGWSYTSLHDFTGGSDGAKPESDVTIDTDGTLYGTAADGGNFEGVCGEYGVVGCGTVWMIKP